MAHIVEPSHTFLYECTCACAFSFYVGNWLHAFSSWENSHRGDFVGSVLSRMKDQAFEMSISF